MNNIILPIHIITIFIWVFLTNLQINLKIDCDVHS